MDTAQEATSGWTFRGRWGRVGQVDRAGAKICALLIAGVLCGCGAARGSSTGNAAVTEAAGGRVFANAVNIRVADLPGAEAAAPESAGPGPSTGALAFARCDRGVSPKRIVLEARSTLLSADRGSLLVRSRVTLWPSGALASRNLAAFASKLGSRCELRYGGTSVSRLSAALPGGARSLGLRAVLPSRSEHTVKIGYHDIIGFVRGPAEIVLTAAGSSRPVEPQTERRLLELLYRRASDARRG
ncbi:MAG: hypothetical protein WAU42_05075 [Solirubrobacteraceae bacterium]